MIYYIGFYELIIILKPILSICIPTFNRGKELKRLINSIPKNKNNNNNNIELIIVDDGSIDNTKQIISEFKKEIDIKYIYQQNQGRSWALHNAIANANGMYTLLMDSDDYFIKENFYKLIKDIKYNQKNFKSFACGTLIKKSGETIKNIPKKEISNFIQLSADKGFKLDLKEIVCTNLLKINNYTPKNHCKRVPTQLLWAKVAEAEDCLCIPYDIAVKEYLPGGMTDNIFNLQMKNIEPLVKLYNLLSVSKKYISIYFRIKWNILLFRYSFHYKKLNSLKIWQVIFIPIGFLFFCFDKLRLNFYD